MIPRIDAKALLAGDAAARSVVAEAALSVGFMTLYNSPFSEKDMADLFDHYRAFFALPQKDKARVDMAATQANRGWGAPGSEQVDPNANPDYKQVFDCGYTVPQDHPLAGYAVYAPNQWPDKPDGFHEAVREYYNRAIDFSRDLLCAIAEAVGADDGYFADKFETPMALLRGNYYPERPEWAGEKDFGIAAHTDYGCLTLLATDGTPGLEVRKRGGGWIPVTAPMGEFVINFGEMLEMWTDGRVKATPHRVVGTSDERLSIPMFFNPTYTTNVAPIGSGDTILAGEHLSKRFDETYIHLKDD